MRWGTREYYGGVLVGMGFGVMLMHMRCLVSRTFVPESWPESWSQVIILLCGAIGITGIYLANSGARRP